MGAGGAPAPGISVPYETTAKTAATATNYDAVIEQPCNVVAVSVYDSGEALNGTLVQASLLDTNSIAVFHFPDGVAGGDTVYSWNGSVPARRKWVIRVTLTGATASDAIVRTLVRPRGKA
jgi:hypothetical protein